MEGSLVHRFCDRISFPSPWAIILPSLSLNRPVQWDRTMESARNTLCLSTKHPPLLISIHQCMGGQCFHPLLFDVSIPLVLLGSSLSLLPPRLSDQISQTKWNTLRHSTRYVHRLPRMVVLVCFPLSGMHNRNDSVSNLSFPY